MSPPGPLSHQPHCKPSLPLSQLSKASPLHVPEGALTVYQTPAPGGLSQHPGFKATFKARKPATFSSQLAPVDVSGCGFLMKNAENNQPAIMGGVGARGKILYS